MITMRAIMILAIRFVLVILQGPAILVHCIPLARTILTMGTTSSRIIRVLQIFPPRTPG